MTDRVIKFRIWDILGEDMIYPDIGYQGHYMLTLKGEFHNFQNGMGGKEVKVMQFTGLQDKNLKDIYEGDIIQYRDGSHQTPHYDKVIVEWVSEKGGYDYNGWKLTDTFLQGGECEVIGNIYQNPDILK